MIYLHNAIPTSRNDDGVGMIGGESDAANPVGVAIILDCVFTFSQCIPQFDRLVPGARYDLTVVNGESDAENVLGK